MDLNLQGGGHLLNLIEGLGHFEDMNNVNQLYGDTA